MNSEFCPECGIITPHVLKFSAETGSTDMVLECLFCKHQKKKEM